LPLLHFILLLLLSPFLLLYFQRLHTSDNDQITCLAFTFVLLGASVYCQQKRLKMDSCLRGAIINLTAFRSI
jgi:uncharacterized membrane protein YhaH (DUF805 family)